MKYLVLFGLLLLAGCTQTSLIPVWRLSPEEVYPASSYLVAIGEGDTRQMAESDAAAGLARMFETNVQPQETHLDFEPDRSLLNILYGETFSDINRRIHIAGFIPRTETALLYKEKITGQAEQIQRLIERSKRTGDPMKKYALLRAAARKALQNDVWLEQLQFIYPPAREKLSLPYDPQMLYIKTEDLAHDITFEIDLKGSASTVTEDAFESALSSLGFSKKRSRAVLSFSGTADFSKTDLTRGSLVFMRYKITVEAQNKNNQPILFLEKSSRTGHLTFDEAKKRAERVLRADIPILVRIKLLQLFDRLAEEN